LARFCENTERHPKETSIRRIYFCAPTVVPGRFIVDELLPVRVEQRQIQIVAYEETALQDLPACCRGGAEQRSVSRLATWLWHLAVSLGDLLASWPRAFHPLAWVLKGVRCGFWCAWCWLRCLDIECGGLRYPQQLPAGHGKAM